jgi:hypothetical protein
LIDHKQVTTLHTPVPWLARGLGSASITPALLLGLVGITLWFADRESPLWTLGAVMPLILLCLLAVAAGCMALNWVRPQRAGLSPPHVMLSLGFGGMFLGLLADWQQTGLAQLGNLCQQSATLSVGDSFAMHLRYLPGMHIGMLLGGLLALPSLRMLRAHCGRYLCSMLTQNLLCSGWMLLGMTLGAVWMVRLQILLDAPSLTGMLGGMFVGMTWGMVGSVAVYRQFFAWRNRAQKRRSAGLTT